MRLVNIVGALTLALLVAGCSAAAAPPSPSPTPGHDLSGFFTLYHSGNWTYNDKKECVGHGGYDDFQPGMPVVVKDQSGSIIGSAETVFLRVSATKDCVMSFDVPAVPDEPFYSVEVGHRGTVTYSAADMAGKGWRLELALAQ